jgi:hypothetical protein
MLDIAIIVLRFYVKYLLFLPDFNEARIVILVTNKMQYLWFIMYSNRVYMFRAILSPILRSTCLYLQPEIYEANSRL